MHLHVSRAEGFGPLELNSPLVVSIGDLNHHEPLVLERRELQMCDFGVGETIRIGRHSEIKVSAPPFADDDLRLELFDQVRLCGWVCIFQRLPYCFQHIVTHAHGAESTSFNRRLFDH
jgi:hypothetical protein